MALKTYNPVTSSQRGLILVDKSALWKGKPLKALTEGKRKSGGRNNNGHVTSRGIVIVRLNSGEQRYIRSDCMATVGAVSNPDNQNQNFAKAGRSRWKGRRPLTRGVAKNPVDHPHGGGEGRTSGGRHPVTPWGKPTKGARTRHNKATDKFIIRSRHAKKKG